MNTEALFLFLILLLGLVLCSFLGGNCNKEGLANNKYNGSSKKLTYDSLSTRVSEGYDNYNHYSGTSSVVTSGTIFYGPNGGSAQIITNSDGSQSLQVTSSTGGTPVIYNTNATSTSTSSGASLTTFYGPNGGTAKIVVGDNGQQAIQIQTSSGTTTYTQNGAYYNPDNTTSTQYYGSTGSVTGPGGNTAYYAQGPYGNTVAGTTSTPNSGTSSSQYYGPYGGSAGSVTGPGGNTAYYAEGPYGNTVAGTTQNPYSGTQYYGPYGGSAGSVTGPDGNTAYYAQGPYGNTVAGTTSNQNYYSAMPPGIPASQIPPGQEDLYILKSEIVPPVCPACPTSAACPRQEPCAPCPACARCPEPSFECKKVPNYNAINNDFLPAPVLNDFSTFGM